MAFFDFNHFRASTKIDSRVGRMKKVKLALESLIQSAWAPAADRNNRNVYGRDRMMPLMHRTAHAEIGSHTKIY